MMKLIIKKLWSDLYSSKDIEEKVYIRTRIIHVIMRIDKWILNLLLILSFWIGIVWVMNNYQEVIEIKEFLSTEFTEISFLIPFIGIFIIVGISCSSIFRRTSTGDLVSELLGPDMIKTFTFDLLMGVFVIMGLAEIPILLNMVFGCIVFQFLLVFIELAFKSYIDHKYHFGIHMNYRSRTRCGDCPRNMVPANAKKYSVWRRAYITGTRAAKTSTDIYTKIASKFDEQSKELIKEATNKAKESESWKNENWWQYYYINRWIITNIYCSNQNHGDVDLEIIDFINDLEIEKFKKLLNSALEKPVINLLTFENKMNNEKNSKRQKYNNKIIKILEMEEVMNALDKPHYIISVDYQLKKVFAKELLENDYK
ncbi:hypothetical protein [Breznakia pachnodae]|uniref:Uncharacterized protein n=1 Tax=Breznakia pachnodae TaxID=265178 RepID=A0ABU0E4A6_9FIRM|nr:hypothetical protein [Breznakia pachnodae]MDQ0361551.1 hypothetical protein [Breznakia pachnodae]